MKRSTNVALTLLIPAMAALGCSQNSSTMPGRQNGAEIVGHVDCDLPAGPGEPEKPRCTNSIASTPHAHTTSHYYGGGWSQSLFGGRTSSTSGSTSSGIAHGGFGGTGAHLSGGS